MSLNETLNKLIEATESNIRICEEKGITPEIMNYISRLNVSYMNNRNMVNLSNNGLSREQKDTIIRTYIIDMKRLNKIINETIIKEENIGNSFINMYEMQTLLQLMYDNNVPDTYFISSIYKVIKNNAKYLVGQGYTLNKIEEREINRNPNDKPDVLEKYNTSTVICNSFLCDLKYGDIKYLDMFLEDIVIYKSVADAITARIKRKFDSIIDKFKEDAKTSLNPEYINDVRKKMTSYNYPEDIIDSTCHKIETIQQKYTDKKEKENENKSPVLERKKVFKRDYNYINEEETKELKKSLSEYIDLYKLELKKEINYDEFLIILSKLIRLGYSDLLVNSFIDSTLRVLPNILDEEDKIAKINYYYNEEELTYLNSLLYEIDNVDNEEDRLVWEETINDEISRLLANSYKFNYKYEKDCAKKIINVQLEQLKEIDNLYYNEDIKESINPLIENIATEYNIDELLEIKAYYDEIVQNKKSDELKNKLFKIVQCNKYNYEKALNAFRKR